MTYSLTFSVGLEGLAEDARRDLEHTMGLIADAVSTIDTANPLWASMDDSLLQIDVGAVRVVYRIDPVKREVRVVELFRRP